MCNAKNVTFAARGDRGCAARGESVQYWQSVPGGGVQQQKSHTFPHIAHPLLVLHTLSSYCASSRLLRLLWFVKQSGVDSYNNSYNTQIIEDCIGRSNPS